MNIDTERVEYTLPRVWETEETFHDSLYDWMQRAPWLAISAAAHLVLFLIIQAIPWNLFQERPDATFTTSIEVPEEIVPDDPIEIPPEVIEDKIVEEPVFQEIETDDVVESDDDELTDQDVGDPMYLSDAPFEDMQLESLIGIGGGSGGDHGTRIPGGRRRGSRVGHATEPILEAGLMWLAKHQSPDGSWDADGFSANCGKIGAGTCTGPGNPVHDVGLTGLALLALLGDGNTLRVGPYRENVARAVRWLREQQDFETGLIGEEIGHSFVYDHSIATLAVCEAYYLSRSTMLRSTAQKALNYISRARNPYGAWRYDVPPIGDEDTSVTGWMVFALKAGDEAGLKVDREAFTGAANFLEQMTDPASGRVGYVSMGSPSSRVTGVNDHFPTEKGEAMTAVGLLSRIFLGQEPKDHPVMEKHADILQKCLPEWDPDGRGNDMYYWYYGTYAMYQMGGRHWKAWSKAMEPAVIRSVRKDGDFAGSWDPVGPWGSVGGRVYSTALMVLSVEVYFRYSRVLGAR